MAKVNRVRGYTRGGGNGQVPARSTKSFMRPSNLRGGAAVATAAGKGGKGGSGKAGG